MRCLIVLLIAVNCLHAETLDLREPDKQAHLATSALLTFAGTQYLKKPMGLPGVLLTSVFSTMALGITKEFLIDKKPSEADLMADWFGVVLGACIVIPLEL